MKKLLLYTLAVAIFATAAALRPAPAAASFHVCNTTGEPLKVAIAADEMYGPMWDEGWWTLQQGDCLTPIAGDLDRDFETIYLYAESATRQWGGGFNICVDPQRKFYFEGRLTSDSCAGREERGFRPIDTGAGSSYTYTFTNERPHSAVLAAILGVEYL